ncbi:hypothetical protein [Niallia sp. NCCP-28]|uniref:hypothetical protein n=1 Tax=Niallia sp. NCCP-28 TaxID=2934712 RepID=UPI00207DF754|nr:hypothetical protein [Niallia sp. NCCP-28]GKU80706.1 hypothetical protein NCCP28_01020 [Niallia sp. NCCP-28]
MLNKKTNKTSKPSEDMNRFHPKLDIIDMDQTNYVKGQTASLDFPNRKQGESLAENNKIEHLDKKDNEYLDVKGQSNSISGQKKIKENIPKPFLLPPPKIEGKHFHSINLIQEEGEEVLKDELMESSDNNDENLEEELKLKDKESLVDEFPSSQEKSLNSIEEAILIMLEELLSMEDESPLLIEKISSDKENELREELLSVENGSSLPIEKISSEKENELREELLSMENESPLLIEKISSKKEKNSKIEEFKHVYDDGENDLFSLMKESLLEQLSDNSVQMEEPLSDKEVLLSSDSNNSSQDASMPEESSNQLEEDEFISNWNSDSMLSLEEEIYSLLEGELDEQIDTSSTKEQHLLSSSPEESSAVYDELEDHFVDEMKKKHTEHANQPQKSQDDGFFGDKPVPVVKYPILLARLNIEINILDAFDWIWPMDNVENIKWSIQNFECFAALPSNTIFFKGTLLASIEYVNQHPNQTLHTIKLPLHVEKVVKANWLYPPLVPSSSQREFMFQSFYSDVPTFHLEADQTFADPVESSLISMNIICHHDLESHEDAKKLHIQGRALISIDLLQEQYVEFN